MSLRWALWGLGTVMLTLSARTSWVLWHNGIDAVQRSRWLNGGWRGDQLAIVSTSLGEQGTAVLVLGIGLAFLAFCIWWSLYKLSPDGKSVHYRKASSGSVGRPGAGTRFGLRAFGIAGCLGLGLLAWQVLTAGGADYQGVSRRGPAVENVLSRLASLIGDDATAGLLLCLGVAFLIYCFRHAGQV